MGLISVREVIKTKGIVFFWKPKNCLVKSWFSLGTWNGRDPWWTPWSRLRHCRHRQRCRWPAWNRTIYNVNFPFKVFCFSNREVLGSIFVLGGIAGPWTNFSGYPLGAGHFWVKQKEYEQIRKNETENKGPGQNILIWNNSRKLLNFHFIKNLTQPFENLVWTHLTSGFCCSSGKDMNSSMEREPDPSRSWAQNGKLQNFTHHRGSCLSIVLDLSFLKRVTISGIILVLWLHVSRVGRPKHVMQKEETSKIWFFCLPKRSGKINETSWLSLFFC